MEAEQIALYKLDRISAQLEGGKTRVTASLTIDPSHHIFSGHFPGQPVLPGVCMIQMVKEILSHHLNMTLFLTEASNIKFLAILDPGKNSRVDGEILFVHDANTIEVDSRLYFESTTFFKMKGRFIPV
jgi:3-hydroxyacyl-[acyl-carrier-protein] dehydratase